MKSYMEARLVIYSRLSHAFYYIVHKLLFLVKPSYVLDNPTLW